MSMSDEEKTDCNLTYALIFGETCPYPNGWNEDAADLLAKAVKDVRDCSKMLRFVVAPPPGIPNWKWLKKYIKKIAKSVVFGKGGMRTVCKQRATIGLKREIDAALVY